MMRIRTRNLLYTPDGPAETKFNQKNMHIRMYDRSIENLHAQLNTWRIITIVAVGSFIFSVIGWYQATKLPKTVPMVIEVSELGVPKYVGKIDKLSYATFQPKDYMIKSHIERFLTNTREIILDTEVMTRNINQTGWWVSRDLRERLRKEIIAADPFSKAGQYKTRVAIESIINTTANTWQADWIDITTSMQGQIISQKKMRGLFTVVTKEPESDEERNANPLGLYIVDYNYTELHAMTGENNE